MFMCNPTVAVRILSLLFQMETILKHIFPNLILGTQLIKVRIRWVSELALKTVLNPFKKCILNCCFLIVFLAIFASYLAVGFGVWFIVTPMSYYLVNELNASAAQQSGEHFSHINRQVKKHTNHLIINFIACSHHGADASPLGLQDRMWIFDRCGSYQRLKEETLFRDGMVCVAAVHYHLGVRGPTFSGKCHNITIVCYIST